MVYYKKYISLGNIMKKIFFVLTLISSTILHCTCSSTELKVGDKAPEFALLNQDGQTVRLSDFIGQKVALYFYPKDNTPGCSQQACSLSDDYELLHENGI